MILSITWSIDPPGDYCFILQINDVVKIQAFIRANKARDDYKTLSKYDPTVIKHTLIHYMQFYWLRDFLLSQNVLT